MLEAIVAFMFIIAIDIIGAVMKLILWVTYWMIKMFFMLAALPFVLAKEVVCHSRKGGAA